MSNEVNMYDTEDFAADTNKSELNITVNKTPMVTELKIGDKTISVVNPEYVDSLQKKLTYMDNRVKVLENELRILRSTMRVKISEIESKNRYYENNDYDR